MHAGWLGVTMRAGTMAHAVITAQEQWHTVMWGVSGRHITAALSTQWLAGVLASASLPSRSCQSRLRCVRCPGE